MQNLFISEVVRVTPVEFCVGQGLPFVRGNDPFIPLLTAAEIDNQFLFVAIQSTPDAEQTSDIESPVRKDVRGYDYLLFPFSLTFMA